MFFFHFATSFFLHTLSIKKRKKKSSLLIVSVGISSICRQKSSPSNIFSWMYLLLIFHFSLSIPLLTFCHTRLPSSQFCFVSVAAFTLRTSAVPAPCRLQYSNHVPTALRRDHVRSESCSSHIRYTALFLYDYLWCAVAKAQGYIKKNASGLVEQI